MVTDFQMKNSNTPLFICFGYLISLSGTLQSHTSLYRTTHYSVTVYSFLSSLDKCFLISGYTIFSSSFKSAISYILKISDDVGIFIMSLSDEYKLYCVQLILLKQHFTVSTPSSLTTLVKIIKYRKLRSTQLRPLGNKIKNLFYPRTLYRNQCTKSRFPVRFYRVTR